MIDRETVSLMLLLLGAGVIVALAAWVAMLGYVAYRPPWERKGWKGGATAKAASAAAAAPVAGPQAADASSA